MLLCSWASFDATVEMDNSSKCALRPVTGLTLAAVIVAEAVLSGAEKKHVEVRLPEYNNVLASQGQASASSAVTVQLRATGVSWAVGTVHLRIL